MQITPPHKTNPNPVPIQCGNRLYFFLEPQTASLLENYLLDYKHVTGCVGSTPLMELFSDPRTKVNFKVGEAEFSITVKQNVITEKSEYSIKIQKGELPSELLDILKKSIDVLDVNERKVDLQRILPLINAKQINEIFFRY